MNLLHLLGVNVSETKEAFNYSALIMQRPDSEHFELNKILEHGIFIIDYWFLPFVAVAIYLPTIFGIQAYMAKREAFDLSNALFLWNSALGIFSVVAVTQMAPEVVRVIWHHGLQNSVCEWSVYQAGNLPLCCLLFTYSKYVHLGDTIFIVLRKKPLVFLQWYHHCVIVIYCWTISPLLEPITIPCAMLNFLEHGLMYSYLAVKLLGYNPPRWVASCITAYQLTVVFAIFGINIFTLHLIRSGVPCRRFVRSIYATFAMFAIFTFMFGKLFVDVVNKKSVVSSKKERVE